MRKSTVKSFKCSKELKELDQKIDELQKQLRSAVDANEFEKAAQLRDEIAKLKEEEKS